MLNPQRGAIGPTLATAGGRQRRATTPAFRWLTVVPPDDPDGPELLLGPDSHPAVRPYKEALVPDGTPAASFAVNDVSAEYERLQALGVKFTQDPLDMGPVVTSVFDDTCGNVIQLAARK
jgi:hypothetical protein